MDQRIRQTVQTTGACFVLHVAEGWHRDPETGERVQEILMAWLEGPELHRRIWTPIHADGSVGEQVVQDADRVIGRFGNYFPT